MTEMQATPSRAPYRAVDLADKAGRIPEPWSPRVVAALNDYQCKVVRIEGDFVWHDHPETDELFVVPRGVEHKPYAAREVKLLLVEPRGVLNTGHGGGERTAKNDIWI